MSALVLLEQHTASSSAELDFTTSISATYDEYLLELLNILPATDTATLYLQVSTNGGSSYDTGSNYRYGRWGVNSAAGSGVSSSASATGVQIADNISNVIASGGGVSGSNILFGPGGTTQLKMTLNDVWQVSGTGSLVFSGGAGIYVPTTAVNAFRLIMSAGNIASGIARCYGVAKV